MEKNIWRFISKYAMSIVTILAGIIVIILTQLNILSQSLQTSMILTLLVLLATSNLIEDKLEKEKLNSRINQILSLLISSGDHFEIITFDNNTSLVEYLIKRSLEASKSIDQASIDYRRTTYNESRMKYDKVRDKIISQNKIKFRYIGMLHTERRLELAKKFIIDLSGMTNFYAAYYTKVEKELPLLNFVVFDKQEVLTRYPFEYGEDTKYIVIKNQQVANLFLGYFNSLWNGAIKIKSKEDYEKLLQEIKR